MRAAREILEGEDHRPRLIGVTVLTSLSEMGLQELGVSRDLESQVDHLARLAHTCGLDGVVCSAQETPRLRQSFGREFCLVTQGFVHVGPRAMIKHGSSHQRMRSQMDRIIWSLVGPYCSRVSRGCRCPYRR